MTLNKLTILSVLILILTATAGCIELKPENVVCSNEVKMQSDGATNWIRYREGSFQLVKNGGTVGVYTPKLGESCVQVSRNMTL